MTTKKTTGKEEDLTQPSAIELARIVYENTYLNYADSLGHLIILESTYLDVLQRVFARMPRSPAGEYRYIKYTLEWNGEKGVIRIEATALPFPPHPTEQDFRDAADRISYLQPHRIAAALEGFATGVRVSIEAEDAAKAARKTAREKRRRDARYDAFVMGAPPPWLFRGGR